MAPKTRIIGWREWIAFPELGVDLIKAKIDTGARTSSIHAFRIKRIEVDGVPHVDFRLHPVQRKKLPEIRCRAPIADRRYVRSSNGEREKRYVIHTHLVIGKRCWFTELTLANRDEMGFRVLIGRHTLPRGMVVDPNSSYRAGQPRLENWRNS